MAISFSKAKIKQLRIPKGNSNFYKKALRERNYRLVALALGEPPDNIVIASVSRPVARPHAVRHRHIEVNNRIVDIPSFILSLGDTIKVREIPQTGVIHDAEARQGRQAGSYLIWTRPGGRRL
jgi:RNA-binding protein YlmH